MNRSLRLVLTSVLTSLALGTGASTAAAASADQATAVLTSTDQAGGAAPVSDRDLLASLSFPDAHRQALLEQIVALLPDDVRERRTAAAIAHGVMPSPVESGLEAALRSAIDPSAYECAPTALSTWLADTVRRVDLNTLIILTFAGGLDVASYDAILNTPGGEPQYFGSTGAWTIPVTHTFRDLRSFWDIDSGDIRLGAMHGTVWQHPDRVTGALALLYDTTPAAVQALAELLVRLVDEDPVLDHGNNPLFTLNAFAFSPDDEQTPRLQDIPDEIIMGDGILDLVPQLGLGTDGVAAKAILAHEFGHHVQYQDDVFASTLTGPEASRRTELMADALGSYFAVHSRGLALNAKRVAEVVENFAMVGDCGFTSLQHHGTPQQRRRAAIWGADLAATALQQGAILPSRSVADRFDDVLPTLVAPDATS